MKFSSWKWRLLSGMICFCLIFQSLTLSVSATEDNGEPLITEMQEVTGETEGTESFEEVEATEESCEGESKEEEPKEEESKEEKIQAEVKEEIFLAEAPSYGQFSEVKVNKSGFGVYVDDCIYTYDLTDAESFYYELYFSCYDKDGNKQSSQYVQYLGSNNASSVNIYGMMYIVHPDTAYVCFELTDDQKNVVESYGNYEVDPKQPNVTLKIEEVSAGIASAQFAVSCEGDLNITNYSAQKFTAYIEYKEKGIDTIKASSPAVYIYSYNDTPANFMLRDLKSDTEYEATIKFRVDFYDQTDYANRVVWEQEGGTFTFTTSKDNTYNLKETFPDSVLREAVVKRLNEYFYGAGYTEDSNVTTSVLEKISSLYIYRDSVEIPAVKDITGIDKLIGLTSLDLSNHEIMSSADVDWSQLTRLQTLKLDNNDMTEVPDLSGCKSLSYVNLNGNKLSEQALAELSSKIPAGANCDNNIYNSQRVNGLEVLLDVDNYLYGDAAPLTVYIRGYKANLGYTVKAFIDGVETNMILGQYYTPQRLSIADTGLEAGAHTIKIALYYGETLVEESQVYDFNFVDEAYFVKETPTYIVSNSNATVSVDVYFSDNVNISKVYLVNESGKKYAETASAGEIYASPSSYDDRYSVVTDASYRSLTQISTSMRRLYNTIPADVYDVVFVAADGSEYVIEDHVNVISSEQAVITSCYLGNGYDSTGDYLYLNLNGNNIDPTKLNYKVTQNGTEYPVSYAAHKAVYGGIIVKMQKDGWKKFANSSSAVVNITPQSGYDIYNGNKTFSVYIQENMFFCAYNPVTNKLETAFAEAAELEGKTFDIVIREGWSESDYPTIATGSAVIADGMAYYELKNADGSAFMPLNRTYYIGYKIGNRSYTTSFYANVRNNGGGSGQGYYNYWNVSNALAGNKYAYTYFYSDIPFGTLTDLAEFKVEVLTADGQDKSNILADAWKYEYNGHTVIGLSYNVKDLAIGTYGVNLYRSGVKLSETAFNIMAADKFILNSVSASWESRTALNVYVNTMFNRESDEFDVILTDYAGNPVEGLSTRVSQRYSNSVYLEVTGLNYEDAQTYYYVKVMHKTLGDAYGIDGNPFYSAEYGNALGNYVQLYYTTGVTGYVDDHGRVIGLGVDDFEVPINVKVYRPYDAEILQEVIVNSEDLTDRTYYFTKSFVEGLPQTDVFYDVVVEDSRGVSDVLSKAVLGYNDMEVAGEDWDYTVDKTLLYLNKADEKIATIKVSDYDKAPTFKSSNTKVVTVTKSGTDASVATIKAIGVGEAVITITADGTSKTFVVTVTKAPEKITLSESTISLTPGDEVELTAQILPAESVNESMKVVYTSSDDSIVDIIETEEGIILEGLQRGNATIIATLEGTDITATCEVNVWDVFVDVELVEDSIPLYINLEDERTAVIEVLDSKTAKPTFKSANTGIVTIAAIADDPTKALITAVGVGETQISVAADGITKTINVVVDRKFIVEGMVLGADALTMTEGTEEMINISMVPAEVQECIEGLEFSVTTSDEEVASAYIDEYKNVVLTALQKGSATISVSVTIDGTEYIATCEVEIVGVFDEVLQQEMAAAEKKYILLNTYPKNTASLKDIVLSEGWTWVDENLKLAADDAAPIQYYAAVYEEEGYQPFTALIPIAVTKLTGISIEGAAALLADTSGAYDIVYKYIGYQPQEDDVLGFEEHYSVTWTASGSKPVVTVEETDTTAVNIAAANVTANKTQSVNVVLKVDNDSKKTFKTTLKLTVLAKPYVDEIIVEESEEQAATAVVYNYDTDAQILYVDMADISTAKGAVANTISFTALAKALDVDSTIKMKWSSSDSSVATVKASTDGKTAVLTVKKAGSTSIKVTAQDAGKYEEEILVVVKDYKPILESSSVTVNLYSTKGSPFVIREQNGNGVTNVELLEKGVVSNKAYIEMTDDGYVIKASADSGITKKTTIKPTLRITTENGEIYDQTISVVIDAKKPTASVAVKTKANLFLTDAEAVYKITSKDVIATVEDITVADGYRFGLADVDLVNGLLVFNTKSDWSPDIMSLYSRNTGKPVTSIKLKVTFDGYTDAAAQTINLTVGTTTTKPSLKMTDITFVPGVTEGLTQVYDNTAKAVYNLTDEDIVVTYDNSKTGDVAAEITDNGVMLTYNGTSTVSYKATLSSERWTQDLVLNGKINVVKQQDLVLENSKITLNTATSVQKNGMTAIGVSVKNYDAAVESISYQTDKASAALINNGYLYFDFDEDAQQILVGLNQNKQGNIKNGTYKFTINGTILVAGQSVSLKKTTLSIALTNKVPTVSLVAKGSIDLVQRADTSILYTPKVTNVTAQVVDVRLKGTYAKYFESQMEDGKIKISATDVPMSTKISYSVDIVSILDNGMEVTKNVKIKPVSKNPKVTAGLTKGILFKASGNLARFGLASSVETAEIEQVVRVTDKNSKYFDFAYEEGKVTISLSEEAAKLKPGNYTISYKVYFEGAAYNVAPVTMKFTATVK